MTTYLGNLLFSCNHCLKRLCSIFSGSGANKNISEGLLSTEIFRLPLQETVEVVKKINRPTIKVTEMAYLISKFHQLSNNMIDIFNQTKAEEVEKEAAVSITHGCKLVFDNHHQLMMISDRRLGNDRGYCLPHRFKSVSRRSSGRPSIKWRKRAPVDTAKKAVAAPKESLSLPKLLDKISPPRTTQEPGEIDILVHQLIQGAQGLLHNPLSSQEQGRRLLALSELTRQMADIFNQTERTGRAAGNTYYQVTLFRQPPRVTLTGNCDSLIACTISPSGPI